jgi:triosephosphate isomerase
MHGNQRTNAELLREVLAGVSDQDCEIAMCVPALYLFQCSKLLRDTGLRWGGQDVSAHEAGAYTGEISAAMLADLECSYVIAGHSERRNFHAETDTVVAQKAARACAAGLTPIVCVGETQAQRESGKTAEVVKRQIDAILNLLSAGDVEKVAIAYEPVWAIGTGLTALPAQAQEVHALLRQRIAEASGAAAAKVRILYGGSVKPGNARELFGMPDIDGGLIGGASLVAADFLAIVNAACRA